MTVLRNSVKKKPAKKLTNAYFCAKLCTLIFGRALGKMPGLFKLDFAAVKKEFCRKKMFRQFCNFPYLLT